MDRFGRRRWWCWPRSRFVRSRLGRQLSHRLGRRGRFRRHRAIVRRAHGQQQVRFIRTPAIADAEIYRLGTPKQFGIGLLIFAGKFVDRTSIMAERKEAPLLRAVIAEWNSGIVLNDGRAVGEDEVAYRREAAGMQKV